MAQSKSENDIIEIVATAKGGSKIKLRRMQGDSLVTSHVKIVYDNWKKEQPQGRKNAKELAGVLGLSRTLVYDVLTGKRRASHLFLNAIEKKLGYRYEWLRIGEKPMKQSNEIKFNVRDVKDVEIELVKFKADYSRYEARQTGIEIELKRQGEEIKELKKIIAEMAKKIL